MLTKLRQAILYRLMILEYKRDVGRLTEKEIDKKWPIANRTERPQEPDTTNDGVKAERLGR
jgi:hypothetical protein